MIDFSKVIKNFETTFNANNVIFDYQIESDMYATRVEHVRSDDVLNCAEHECDFGNYKQFGLDNTLYRLFDVNDGMYVVSPVSKKAFKCERVMTGDYFDRSSRWALVKEVEVTDKMKKSIEFYESDEVRAEAKKQWKSIVLTAAVGRRDKAKKGHEDNLKVLEDLKVNHKRAFRQIANAEKVVAKSCRSLGYYEHLVKEITAI